MSSKSFLIFFMSFIFLTTIVSAIGVSPPSYKSEFSELETEHYTFLFFTNGPKTKIHVSVDGALAEYAKLSITDFVLEQNGRQNVVVTLKYPKYADLDIFGEQRLNVRGEEMPLEGEGFNAITAVVGLLKLTIPIPGEYAKILNFDIPYVEKGEDTEIKLNIANKGTDALIGRSATVEITSPENLPLETITISDINILPQQTKELTKTLVSKNYIEGKYSAKVTFDYSYLQEPEIKIIDFFIGKTDIILTNYTKEVIAGKINRIDLTFQSIWGSQLTAVRSSLNFNNKIEELPPLDFEPFGIKQIPAYIDVPLDMENIAAELEIKVPLNDEEFNIKTLNLFFTIKEEKTFGLSNTTLIIIVIGILIISLLILSMILISRKHEIKK